MSRVACVAGFFALNALAVAHADEPAQPAEWIVEPTPEAADAATAGAALEAHAQDLARQKDFDQAVKEFEQLDRQVPSSLHDCYLALSYLRSDDLTRAQLFADVARLRKGARPVWCEDDLARQLAAKLRQADYAPLTLKVSPHDAVVKVSGLSLRGVDALWLRPGTYEVSAHAPGLQAEVAQVAVTPPGSSVTLSLHPPPPPQVAPTPQAPIATRTPDLTPRREPNASATRLQLSKSSAADQRVLWPAWVGFGVGGASLATGVLFRVLAASSRNSANQEYVGTPAFQSASDDFSRDRTLALGGYALGALATGLGAWWYATHHEAAETADR